MVRALYRDADETMLLTLPRDGKPAPDDACHAPLLVGGEHGVTRRLVPAEVAARIKHMQLAGAVEGTCPQHR